MTTNFFQRFFASCFVVFTFKVSNDYKYLLRLNIIKDCLESDVHHMTSQILSILIDFIEDHTFFIPFFRSFYQRLNITNFGARNDIKKW